MDNSRKLCVDTLADRIAECLTMELEAVNHASLLLPGGTEFIGLYESLSLKSLTWEKVRISLSVENFVGPNHEDRFESILKTHLFQNRAENAKLTSLVQSVENFEVSVKQANVNAHRLIKPLTCVVLDLKKNGQTAGISTNASNYNSLMDFNPATPDILGSNVPENQHRCITYTRKALLDTRHLFIHFYGQEHQTYLSSIINNPSDNNSPISGFLNGNLKAEIHWST